jgi:hypothetical protein
MKHTLCVIQFVLVLKESSAILETFKVLQEPVSWKVGRTSYNRIPLSKPDLK